MEEIEETTNETKPSYIYRSFAPSIQEEGLDVYFDQLDAVYSNKEVKNIAITGIYGAGKSTIWRSYVNRKNKENNLKWTDEKILNVSLADFEDVYFDDSNVDGEETTTSPQDENSSSTSQNIAKYSANRIEKQIINQILYQVESNKIPLSPFVLKETGNEVNYGLIFSLLSVAIGLILFQTGDEIHKVIPLSSDIHNHVKLFIIFLPYILVVIPLLFFLYKQLPRLAHKIVKISIKGAEATINDDSDGILVKEMHEVVYLINASGAHTVVFEDLDRFEDINLFVKLREINILVNKKSQGPIRFFYMLKDEIFTSKDRTKFFDMIIPVVPYINSHNSRGKLLELFQDLEESYYHPGSEILERTSLYLDDMRIIYSIRNEYEIYSKYIDLEKRDLNPSKLFGLLVFKNLFPKDFDDLQQDKGYVYEFFENADKYRNKLISDIQKEINELSSKFDLLEDSNAKNVFDLITNYLDTLNFNGLYPSGDTPNFFIEEWSKNPGQTKQLHVNNDINTYTYNQLLNEMLEIEDFKKMYDVLDNKTKKERINALGIERKELSKEKQTLELSTISDFLNRLNSDQLEYLFVNDKYEKIIHDHYFNLIRFLILEGLVDETYTYYRGCFIKNSLDIADEIYLRKLRIGEALEPTFKVSNPEIIIRELSHKDLSRSGILNYTLLDTMINLGSKEKLQKSVMTILNFEETKIGFFQYLNSLEEKVLTQFVNLIILDRPIIISRILMQKNMFHEVRNRLAGLSLIAIAQFKDVILDHPFAYDIVSYIAKHAKILEENIFKNNDQFVQSLLKVNIKFQDLEDIDMGMFLAEKISKYSLYNVTFTNSLQLMSILRNEDKFSVYKKYFTLLNNEQVEKQISNDVLKNIDNIMKSYVNLIEEMEIQNVENSEEDTILLLNNDDIESDNKINYLKINDSIINDLNEIEDEKLWEYGIKYKRIKYSEDNIQALIDHSIDENILHDYLNQYYMKSEPNHLPEGLENQLINKKAISDKVFDGILNNVTEEITKLNQELPKNRIIKLIDNNKISVNQSNLIIVLDKKIPFEIILQYLQSNIEESSSIIVISEILDKFSEDNIVQLLNADIFNDEVNQTVIKNTNYRFSIFDLKNATDFIQKYVLENNWDQDDIEIIVKTPNDFPQLSYFFIFLSKRPDILGLVYQEEMSYDFVEKFINSSDLNDSDKTKLVKVLITNNTYLNKIPELLEKIEDLKELSLVFSNKKPSIENENQNSIAHALEEQDIVSITDSKLNFRPRKYKNLLLISNN